jgi:TonB family protein
MRVLRSLVILTFVCACAQPAAGQTESAQAAAWTRYTYPGEEFSVELPGAPTVFNTFRAGGPRPHGDTRVRVFSLYHERVIYFLVAYDEPRSSESDEFFATYLRGAWGLEPKGELKLGGVKGRAFDVVGTQRGRLTYDLRGEGRVFRTKRHAYLALALTEEAGRPEVTRFLNSLALKPNPTDERIAGEEPVPRYVPPTTPEGPPPRSGALALPGGPADDEQAGGAERKLKVVRKASIVYKPEPPYTEEARKNRAGGVVRLAAVLHSSGRVTDFKVLKPLPNGLTESAIRVARQMRFFPAQLDGRPVSQWVTLEYNFSIY